VCVSFVAFILFYRYFPLATFVLSIAGSPGAWFADLLQRLGIPSVDAGTANAAAYACGMLNSFILNRRWTFEAGGLVGPQLRRFIILNLGVLVGSTAVVFVFIDLLRAPYLLVWIITTGVGMIVNFLGNKYWTFAEASNFADASRRAPADGNA
jgi:putative flippase GtrA